jgi:hypothetical protein
MQLHALIPFPPILQTFMYKNRSFWKRIERSEYFENDRGKFDACAD